jgi:hypothetical protein
MTREKEVKLFAWIVKHHAFFREPRSVIEDFEKEEKIELSEEEKTIMAQNLQKFLSVIERHPVDL